MKRRRGCRRRTRTRRDSRRRARRWSRRASAAVGICRRARSRSGRRCDFYEKHLVRVAVISCAGKSARVIPSSNREPSDFRVRNVRAVPVKRYAAFGERCPRGSVARISKSERQARSAAVQVKIVESKRTHLADVERMRFVTRGIILVASRTAIVSVSTETEIQNIRIRNDARVAR